MAKLVYQTGQATPQRTDYLGPYQYEQDSLKFFPHAEGRVLRFVSYDAARQAKVSYQREFTFKDHLGNLRLAYRAGQTRTYLASLEQDEPTRKRETQQFDSLSVSPPIAVATPYTYGGGTYVARLNAGGAAPQPLGPLTQLTVQKGDTLRVLAPGLYPQKVSNSSFAFSLASFVASLVQPAPAGSPAGIDGSRRGGLPLLQLGLGAGVATLPQLSGGVPKGYLRVLVFNQDSALIDQRTLQLSKDALGNYEVLDTKWLPITQNGYATVYVGNESAADVYFDELRIEHRQGLQVQENEYDPYGLDLAGVSGAAPGLRGKNFYQFNGKERQNDLGLNWSDYGARMYDWQLGKWHTVDPLAQRFTEYSPYNYVLNNPLNLVDPTGKSAEEPQSAQYISYSYTYNGKNNHTITKTTTNVSHIQDKKGKWQIVIATSNLSLSFKTSSNKDQSVNLDFTKASIGTRLRTVEGAEPMNLSKKERQEYDSRFTKSSSYFEGTLQSNSSRSLEPVMNL